MNRERIERELALLREGGQRTELILVSDQEAYVLYREVPTGGTRYGLPSSTDAIVPVPFRLSRPPDRSGGSTNGVALFRLA